ncbi:hypothetical protein NXS19_011442 [Fusarium pseudograminearum]|nr:hypothetical protein NXS19_011442 [Fusarium pseudograminearum]
MVVPHMVIRQEAQVITQTVELPSTTYTTYVTLGVVSAAATDRPVAVPSQHSGDGLSGAEIGAIVGAVVGFFILSFVVAYAGAVSASNCAKRAGSWGPKFPTYRAIPIPNPRRAASNLPRTYR